MSTHEGKTVVITGGGSGIGLATARLLVDAGARVLITGRDHATLDAARDQLGENATAVRSDAGSVPDIAALADRVRAEFGTVDALFVNAGINGFAPFESTSESLFDQLLTVNAKGPYFTVQKLAPLMSEGSGVVLTTSVANVLGLPTLSAYAATKAAVRSMTRSLARELLPGRSASTRSAPAPSTPASWPSRCRRRRPSRRKRRWPPTTRCCGWERLLKSPRRWRSSPSTPPTPPVPNSPSTAEAPSSDEAGQPPVRPWSPTARGHLARCRVHRSAVPSTSAWIIWPFRLA